MLSAADLATPERLQEHMRAVARRQYDAVRVPPFTLYFHPSDPLPYLNYAIPDETPGTAAALAAPLARLRAEFALRKRKPRFEFVEEVFPALAGTLEASGFVREARPQLMLCRPSARRRPEEVPGLSIEALSSASPVEAFREFLKVQRLAFGLPEAGAVSLADARWLRDGLGEGLALVGRLGGVPVSVSMFLDPSDGLTELVGICTLEPHRRRGLGGALTYAALEAAFARGVAVAFLSAADAEAGRVYEAAGFARYGNVLFMVARDEAPGAAVPPAHRLR
jgi:GNAT superfamily N-acetyltransferase